MAWIVKLAPTPAAPNPLAGALSGGKHPALRRHLPRQGRGWYGQASARARRSRRILRPTLTRPRLDAVRRVRHHDLVAQLGRTRRTPWPRREWPATRRHRVLFLGRASPVCDWTPCPCLSTRVQRAGRAVPRTDTAAHPGQALRRGPRLRRHRRPRACPHARQSADQLATLGVTIPKPRQRRRTIPPPTLM